MPENFLSNLREEDKSDFFFDEAIGSGYKYTIDPIGAIDFDRFVSGKSDFFLRPVDSAQKKRKNLLVCDWTLTNNITIWGNLKEVIISCLNDHQCRIFICQDNNIIEIKSEEDLNKIDLKKIKPLPHSEMHRILLEDHSVISDQVKLLDLVQNKKLTRTDYSNFFNATKLNLESLTSEQIASLQETAGFSLEAEFRDISKLLSSGSKQLQKLVETKLCRISLNEDVTLEEFNRVLLRVPNFNSIYICCDKYSCSEFIKIFQNHPFWTAVNDVEISGNLTTVDDVKFFIEHITNLKKIHIVNVEDIKEFSIGLRPEHSLPNLEEIEIVRSDISANDISFLLECSINLRKIKLDYVGDIRLRHERSLQNLEEVEISNSSMSAFDVGWLLAHAPNLRKIKLDYVGDIRGVYLRLDSEYSLPNLEEITISGTNILGADISWILLNANNLKTIDLHLAGDIGGFADVLKIEHSLHNLELLNISTCMVKPSDIGFLFKHATKLRKIEILSVTGTKEFSNVLNSEHQLLILNLEEVIISASEFNACDIGWILAHAPNLKRIKFDDIGDITGFADRLMPAHSLINLEEIEISKAIVSASDVVWLLPHSPNLKKIKLDDIGDIRDFSKTIDSSVKLLNLEEIEISSSSLTASDISFLLSYSPNLKKINFRYVGDIRDFSKTIDSSVKLLNLEEIEISKSMVSASDVIWLLSHCPNLKKITFYDVGDIRWFSNLFNLDFNSNLEYINISYNSIADISDIKWILNHSPCLRTIHLIDCKNISGCFAQADKQKLKLLDTVFISNRSSISDADWAWLTINKIKVIEIGLFAKPADSSYESKENPELGRASDESIGVDGNIAFNKDRFLIARKIFVPLCNAEDIPPNNYRIGIYNEIEQKDGSIKFKKNAGLLEQKDTSRLWLTKSPEQEEYNHDNSKIYYGRCSKVNVKAGELFPLPSISAMDTIIGLYLPEEYRQSFDLLYSKELNLYYLKNKGDYEVTTDVGFVVDVPLQNQNQILTLPADVQNLIKDYQNFGEAKENLGEGLSDIDKLEKIIASKTGACRHRSKAFMFDMKRKFPEIKIRIVCNDVHEYVEIELNGKWVRIDLGGYVGQVVLDSSNLERQIIDHPIAQLSQVPLEPVKFELVHDEPVPYEPLTPVFLKIIKEEKLKTNVLLKLKENDIPNALFYLNQLAQEEQKPVYYINSPEDFYALGYTFKIQQVGDEKIGLADPESQLKKFLTDPKNKDGIIIINWKNFPNDKFISHHSVIDAKRNIQSIPLPDTMKVVSLYPEDSLTTYRGEDFNRRHTEKIDATCYSSDLEMAARHLRKDGLALKFDNRLNPDSYYVVDFYNNKINWKQYLIGKWILQGEKPVFHEGILQKALRSGKNLLLKNAPWELEEFNLFLQNLFFYKKFECYGEEIPIPPNGFSIYCQDGLSFEKYKTTVIDFKTIEPDKIPQDAYILNPTLHNSFLMAYRFYGSHLVQLPGILEQHKNQTIKIYITREISVWQFAELFDNAQIHNVKLDLYFSPGINIPSDFNKLEHKDITTGDQTFMQSAFEAIVSWLGPAQEKKEEIIYKKPEVYVSDDIDSTVSKIAQEYKKSKTKLTIITISDREFSDIFFHLNAEKYAVRNGFSFNIQETDIFRILENGGDVLLRGRISKQLSDQISTLLTHGFLYYNGEKKYFKGKLTIVSNSKDLLKYCKNHVNPSIEHSEILHLAEEKKGVPVVPSVMPEMNLDLKLESSIAFNETRLNNLIGSLRISFFINIEGSSGSGKSTFVNVVLKEKGHHIYNITDQDALSNWAQDSIIEENKYKILFIDEANLTNNNWMMFRDMLNDPPIILLNGKIITLTAQHRIIFAGNKLSYGAGRYTPELIEHYSKKVVFEKLSPAYLYNVILKPLKPNNLDDALYEHVCKLWLEIYIKANANQDDKEVLTARELESMALLFRYWLNSLGAVQITQELITKEALLIASQICMPQLTKAKFDIKSIFPQEVLSNLDLNTSIVEGLQKQKFIYMPSRMPAYTAIDNFLNIRSFKLEHINDQISQTPGLGGVLISGSPGIGKSEFIRAVLKSKGYRELDISSSFERNLSLSFISLPTDLSVADKERLLKIAYEKGLIVIIDELNTPFTEQLLNGLIGTRNAKAHPGFMIFGTQNPASMAGRQSTSDAILHRFLKVDMPDYTKQELMEIERKKVFSEENIFKRPERYYKLFDMQEKHDFTFASMPADRMMH